MKSALVIEDLPEIRSWLAEVARLTASSTCRPAPKPHSKPPGAAW